MWVVGQKGNKTRKMLESLSGPRIWCELLLRVGIWAPGPDSSFHPSLIGAGADFVMLGGMLAGHSESGGELIKREGKKYKLFYGMSSETAMKKYAGGIADYRYV